MIIKYAEFCMNCTENVVMLLQAQMALQEKLETDTFLQERVESFSVGAHQKNVYSIFR